MTNSDENDQYYNYLKYQVNCNNGCAMLVRIVLCRHGHVEGKYEKLKAFYDAVREQIMIARKVRWWKDRRGRRDRRNSSSVALILVLGSSFESLRNEPKLFTTNSLQKEK